MKPLHCFLAVASVSGMAVAVACATSQVAPAGDPPDAMLLNTDDVSSSDDASGGPPEAFTWIRFGNLAPGLGPVRICLLPPGSDTWVSFLGSPPPDASPDTAPGPDGGRRDSAAPDSTASDRVVRDAGSDAPGDAPREAARDVLPEDPAPDAGLVDAGLDVADVGSSDGENPDADREPYLLAPMTMTTYRQPGKAGTFGVAILPAGTSDCLGGYFTQEVTADPSQYNTVVVVQTHGGPSSTTMPGAGADAAAAYALESFTDEHVGDPQAARTRFVDLVTPATDAGAGPLAAAALDESADLVPLASLILPGQASSPNAEPPTVDALGYHSGFAMHGRLALRIGPAGDGGSLPWTSEARDLGLSVESIHSGFIVSSPTQQYAVLWCNDLSQESFLADCTVLLQ